MKRRILRDLPLALLCLAMSDAWTQGAPQAPPPSQPADASKPAKKPLDLHLRNAKDLLSENEWENLLARQPPVSDEEWKPPEEQAEETAEVKGRRPQVPDGIGALFWALRHPTQAWRIFAPATSPPKSER